jgi:hypothetical protein
MANKPPATWLVDDVADFLASRPSREELLAYRPSFQAQERFNALLDRSKKGSLSWAENRGRGSIRQTKPAAPRFFALKSRTNSRRSAPALRSSRYHR